MSNSTQSFKLTNVPAGNYPISAISSSWTPKGGGILGGKNYVLTFSATGAGTAQLAIKAADGVTWVPCSTSMTGNASQVLTLCPGEYELQITGFTACYASLNRVPD